MEKHGTKKQLQEHPDFEVYAPLNLNGISSIMLEQVHHNVEAEIIQ